MHNFKKSGLIALFIGFFLLLSFAVHWLAIKNLSLLNGFDLTKNWSVCVHGSNRCEDYKINLPDKDQIKYKSKIDTSIEYRNEFITPTLCLNNKLNDCVFFIGGVYQGARVWINDTPLGSQFSSFNLFPFKYSISPEILKKDKAPNQIRMQIYSESSNIVPAVIQLPIGITDYKSALTMTFSIIGERIILPVLGIGVCFTLIVISLFWMLSKNAHGLIVRKYFLFCISATLYLFSLTRVPREYLSLLSAASLNFGFAVLMNFTIFSLVISFYSISSKFVKFIKYYYYFSLFVFFGLFGISLFFPEVNYNLAAYFKSTGATLTRRSDIIYVLLVITIPVTIIGNLIPIYQSAKFYNKIPGSRVLLLLFIFVVPMQLFDLSLVIRLIQLNHEIFYTRLYIPFIGLAFCYAIWLKWIEREQTTEATLKIGTIAQRVAHDLKSPLSVLKLLSKVTNRMLPEEKELLNSAMNSIDKIASKLLLMYRSSVMQSSDGKMNFEPYPLDVLLANAIKSRNFVLSEKGQLRIELEVDPDQNYICNLISSEIERVFNNILNNAVEAVAEVQNKKIKVLLSKQNDMVEIQIIDNGKGVDDHLLRWLNDKEFGKTTKSSGHGIGLGQAWEVIHSHSGSLGFIKPKTGGMIVRILIPLIPSSI